MDKLRIPLVGKKDKNDEDYYYSTTTLPVLLDLNKSVIHVYPWEEDDGSFGAELVIRHYDPNFREKQQDRRRGRKTRRTRPQSESPETGDSTEASLD